MLTILVEFKMLVFYIFDVVIDRFEAWIFLALKPLELFILAKSLVFDRILLFFV